MEDSDIVMIYNYGDTRWEDRFNNQRFIADPGKSIVVPWPAAKLWLGNPAMRDDHDRGALDRKAEYHRLCVRYGVKTDGSASWEEERPKIEARDFDQNKISMVADDPTGKGVHEAFTTENDQELLQRQINELTRKLGQMEAMRGSVASVGDEEVTEDAPSKVPTGRVQSDDE